MSPVILPVDLYRPIMTHVRNKADLVSLSVLSPSWQVEAEKLLWEYVTLCDDSLDWHHEEDLISVLRLQLLISRVGQYVRKLTLRFQQEALEVYHLAAAPPGYNSPRIRKPVLELRNGELTSVGGLISQAIGAMTNLRHLTIYNNDRVAKKLMKNISRDGASHSFNTIRSIEFKGQFLSAGLATFFTRCPNLTYLSCDATVVEPPRKDEHVALSDHSWQNLTILVAHLGVALPILSSSCRRVYDLTILVPSDMEREMERYDFGSIPLQTSVEVLRFGDERAICKPFNLPYIHTMVKKFPNLRELRRVPISEDNGFTYQRFFERFRESHDTNLSRICEVVKDCPKLEFISLADHTVSGSHPDLAIGFDLAQPPGFSPERIAYSLQRAAPQLKEAILLPWPPSILHRVTYEDANTVSIEEIPMNRGLLHWI